MRHQINVGGLLLDLRGLEPRQTALDAAALPLSYRSTNFQCDKYNIVAYNCQQVVLWAIIGQF